MKSPKTAPIWWLCSFALLLLLTSAIQGGPNPNEKEHVQTMFRIMRDSTLTGTEQADSIVEYKYASQYWEVSDYGCKSLMPIVDQRLKRSKNLEEEYAWVRLSTKLLHSCGTLGERVIMTERRIALAEALEDSLKLFSSYEHLSLLYSEHDMYDLELEYANKGVQLLMSQSQIDSTQIAHHASGHGYRVSQIAYDRGDSALLNSALKYTRIAYRHAPKTMDLADPAIIHAMTLARANQRAKAIQVALATFKHVKELGDRYYQYRFARQLGGYYAHLNKKDSALYWIKQCFQIQRPEIAPDASNTIDIGPPYGLVDMNSLYYLVSAHMSLDEYDVATDLLDQVLYSDFNHEAAPMTAFYRETAAKVYWKIQEYRKAAENYRKSLDHARKQKDKLEDNFLEASHAHTKVQIRLQREKAQAKEKRRKFSAQKEAERQRFQRNGFILGTGGLLIFLVFLYNRFRVTRKQKTVIEKQKDTVQDALNQVQQKNKEIYDSISYARRLQNAIMPPMQIFEDSFEDFFIYFHPKEGIGGDFYFAERTANSTFIAVADCTGHGVPGAMVSVVCANGLTKAIMEDGLENPAEILDRTRDHVMRQFEGNNEGIKDGMDIGLIKLSPGNSPNTRNLEFAGANNPVWIKRKASSTGASPSSGLEEFKGDKQPIGKHITKESFTMQQTEVHKGDILYLLSDGFPDQFGGPKGKKFKAKNLQQLLVSLVDQSMEEQKQSLDQTFQEWKGNHEQVDDVCLIGLRV